MGRWSGYLLSTITPVQTMVEAISIPDGMYTNKNNNNMIGALQKSYLFGQHGVRAKQRNHGWISVMYFMLRGSSICFLLACSVMHFLSF